MARLFSDNYTTTITSGISDSATTIPVASVANLPAIGGGDSCILTIQEGSTIERVEATAVSSLDLTVTRAADGSSASAFSSGALISLRASASAYEDRPVKASTSTDNSIPRHDGTDGKKLQDSGVTISDNDEMAGAGVTISSKTDSYSVVAADAGTLIKIDKATASTFTLPDPSTVDDGFQVGVVQEGAGTVSVATSSGSILSKGSATDLSDQYAMAVAVKFSSTEWGLFGDLA